MRLKSSRQLSPASTRMRVRPPVTTVLFPLDPEARTVKRIMHLSIPRIGNETSAKPCNCLSVRAHARRAPLWRKVVARDPLKSRYQGGKIGHVALPQLCNPLYSGKLLPSSQIEHCEIALS